MMLLWSKWDRTICSPLIISRRCQLLFSWPVFSLVLVHFFPSFCLLLISKKLILVKTHILSPVLIFTVFLKHRKEVIGMTKMYQVESRWHCDRIDVGLRESKKSGLISRAPVCMTTRPPFISKYNGVSVKGIIVLEKSVEYSKWKCLIKLLNKQISSRRAFAKTGLVKYGHDYCIPVTVIKGRAEEGSGAERKGEGRRGPWAH